MKAGERNGVVFNRCASRDGDSVWWERHAGEWRQPAGTLVSVYWIDLYFSGFCLRWILDDPCFQRRAFLKEKDECPIKATLKCLSLVLVVKA